MALHMPIQMHASMYTSPYEKVSPTNKMTSNSKPVGFNIAERRNYFLSCSTLDTLPEMHEIHCDTLDSLPDYCESPRRDPDDCHLNARRLSTIFSESSEETRSALEVSEGSDSDSDPQASQAYIKEVTTETLQLEENPHNSREGSGSESHDGFSDVESSDSEAEPPAPLPSPPKAAQQQVSFKTFLLRADPLHRSSHTGIIGIHPPSRDEVPDRLSFRNFRQKAKDRMRFMSSCMDEVSSCIDEVPSLLKKDPRRYVSEPCYSEKEIDIAEFSVLVRQAPQRSLSTSTPDFVHSFTGLGVFLPSNEHRRGTVEDNSGFRDALSPSGSQAQEAVKDYELAKPRTQNRAQLSFEPGELLIVSSKMESDRAAKADKPAAKTASSPQEDEDGEDWSAQKPLYLLPSNGVHTLHKGRASGDYVLSATA
eukprot:gnl/TRDRNA2_/TRDRNA2_43259_c0_seq1.p1 gnl/TRDRNA2_/TRDRNA2_43259_c0~~gnl/TRDRNA2_/TRDRNA2_43259_c0_seq1.p1  ORF type:complete len:423 (+),score=72.01 gnl/TRDRNA2_/TRDRNA2_43259_c0_seq1:75-1343(+)